MNATGDEVEHDEPRLPGTGLSAEEEVRLANIIQGSEPDSPEWLAARNELVSANYYLVRDYSFKVYKRYPGLSLEDVDQAAYLGLIRAAEKFNPEKDCRFSTYAYKWMKEKTNREFINTAKLIRIPAYRYEEKAIDQCPAVTAFESQIPSFRNITAADEKPSEGERKRRFVETLVAKALDLHDVPTRELLCKRFGIGRPKMWVRDIGREMGVSRQTVVNMTEAAIELTRKRFLAQGRREMSK